MHSLFLSVSLFMTGMYMPSDRANFHGAGQPSPSLFLPLFLSLLHLLLPIFQLPLPPPQCPSYPLSLFSLLLPSLLSTFSSLSFLFLLPSSYSPISFLLYPCPPSPDWKSEQSGFKLELEENKYRKSINSLEMILSTEHTIDWRSQ